MSNGDKRSVSTDALETLGTIIAEGQGRDAIHLAVDPVVADIKLYPGQDVGLISRGRATSLTNDPVGIVDPFLKAPVQAGEHFWLVVYPRQITSLRHVWTHPKFPEELPMTTEAVDSEKWLRKWCDKTSVASYETIIEAVTTGRSGKNDDYGDFEGLSFHGNYFCTIGYESKEVTIPDEFWDHLEVVTGQKFHTRTDYFSCSC